MDHLPQPSPDSARSAARAATYKIPLARALSEDQLRDLLDTLTPAEREGWARGTFQPHWSPTMAIAIDIWTTPVDPLPAADAASIERVGERLGIPAEPFGGSPLLLEIDDAFRAAAAGRVALGINPGRGMAVDPELAVPPGTRISRRAARGAGRHGFAAPLEPADPRVEMFDDRSPVGKRIVVALAVLALLAAVCAIVNLRGG